MTAFNTLKTGNLLPNWHGLQMAEIKGIIEGISAFEKLLREREYLEGT